MSRLRSPFLSKGSYFTSLYTSLDDSAQLVDGSHESPHIEFVGTPNGNADPLTDISFLSPKIQSYIYKKFPVLYRVRGAGAKTQLFVGGVGSKGLPKKVRQEALAMFRIVSILQNLFDKGGRSQTIYYYPTPFKKSFQRKRLTPLGPNEVNSGVTFLEPAHNHGKKNGMIILFRQEEAMKVLIHELIHSFHLDFQIIQHSIALKRDVCSNYPVLLNEAFTESFATLIHLYFVAQSPEKDTLRRAFRQELKYELSLCRRILHENGLQIADLPKLVGEGGKECMANFQQYTNVFSYYILKPCILQDIGHFDRFMKLYTQKGAVLREGVQILENHIFDSLRNPHSNFAQKLAKSSMYKGNSLKMVYGKII